MPKFTQRQELEQVLLRHGCKPVKATGRNWTAWTTGDILPPTVADGTPRFLYLGVTGFRVGCTKVGSIDHPRLKARLLAENSPERVI